LKVVVEKALSKNQKAVNRQFRQLYYQAIVDSKTEEFDFEILKAFINTTVFTKALITFIIIQNLSYTIVE
jgi:hypothetical protein